MTYLRIISVCTVFLLAVPITAASQEAPERLPAPTDEVPVVEQLDKASRPINRNSQRLSIAPAGLMFASFDSDGDYRISRTEANAGIAAAFIAADKNNNGTLSLVEVDIWRERALGSLDLLPGNTQFDRDFNAVVTRAEFTEVLTRTGARLDKDENSVLDFSELLAKVPAQREVKRERKRIFNSRADRQRRR